MKLNVTPSSEKAQHGQALPLGLAFIAVALLLCLVVFNTGQIASEKAQVANTADAAVYSGLVWQARSLNFQAYTNRAMVANQVSIAQMVSLSSWTNYGRISARNLDTAIGWVPVIAPFTEALLQGMETIEDVVQIVAEVAIPIIDGANSALSVAQEGVYNASYIATPEVVSAVVKANDSHYRAASTYSIAAGVRNAKAWGALSARQNDEAGLARKADVINRSLDKFSGNRGWNRLPGLPRRVQVTPVDRFTIIKEGTTKLAQNGTEWEWRGKDGLSIHWEHYKCSWRGCRWKRQEIPMGWGSNYAEGDGACSGNACSNLFASNGWAEYLADVEAEDLSGYSGVKSYRSLKDLSSANRDPRLVLRVEVEVNAAAVRTAEQLNRVGSAAGELRKGLETGMFHTADSYAGDALASLAAGEVFFERPVSTAGELRVAGISEPVSEYANLFNPYWGVRLIEPGDQERQASWLLRSPELIDVAFVPGFANGAASAADWLTGTSASASNQTLSAYTRLSHNDARDYEARGRAAISDLQGGVIEDAITDAAVDAMRDAVSSAASSSADTNGFGNAYGTAGKALEASEVNSEDLRGKGDRAAENSAIGGTWANAAELANGVLENADGLADSLLVTAGVTDAVTQVTSGLAGEAVELGDQLQESIAETFATELNLTEQLTGLQESVDAASASGAAASNGAINSATDDLKNSITTRFESLQITPETVSDGALQDAGAFVGEQVKRLQSSVAHSLGPISGQGETLLDEQAQSRTGRAPQQGREATQQGKKDLNTGLPRYVE